MIQSKPTKTKTNKHRQMSENQTNRQKTVFFLYLSISVYPGLKEAKT